LHQNGYEECVEKANTQLSAKDVPSFQKNVTQLEHVFSPEMSEFEGSTQTLCTTKFQQKQ